VRRISSAVETGDHRKRSISLNNKHQSVGKAAKQGAPDAPVDDRKLPGIGAHALDHGINRRAKTSA
jgi:hypothetical protein